MRGLHRVDSVMAGTFTVAVIMYIYFALLRLAEQIEKAKWTVLCQATAVPNNYNEL